MKESRSEERIEMEEPIVLKSNEDYLNWYFSKGRAGAFLEVFRDYKHQEFDELYRKLYEWKPRWIFIYNHLDGPGQIKFRGKLLGSLKKLRERVSSDSCRELLKGFRNDLKSELRNRNYKNLDVCSLALDTFIMIRLGRIKPFPEAGKGKKAAIHLYGEKLGVSKNTFYDHFNRIDASSGKSGYKSNQVDKLDQHYEDDPEAWRELQKLTNTH